MEDDSMSDEIVKAKIRRALLSGPESVTREATVPEMDAQGKMTVLRPGSNQWVCIPGNENIVGQADMCADPMGMRWMMDVMAKKPKPTNTEPGLIYMLNGALQHSYTDPFDRTSPAIPIGPHWMILWPFDATAAGLPTVVRDAGTLVMFAGTPYAPSAYLRFTLGRKRVPPGRQSCLDSDLRSAITTPTLSIVRRVAPAGRSSCSLFYRERHDMVSRRPLCQCTPTGRMP